VSSSASKGEPYLRVGALKRPHALRGEISVQPVGDFPGMIRAGARLSLIVAGGVAPPPLVVESVRPHGTHLLVKFAGRDTVEAVADLSGKDLAVERESLARPSEDFLFDDEVAGFACVSAGGEPLGSVDGFERHGPTCFLRIRREEADHLVPFVRPIVREVSRERREIVLDLPDGLFEI
jgi:16S rRNA processing protein RimM